MSKSFVALLAAVTVIAFVPRSGAADSPVHQVSGGGTVEYGGALNVHSFIAKVDDEGNVEGHADFQLRHRDLHIQIEIECLSVVENNAWMSGTIRESSDPALVGEPVLFRVQDNDGAAEAIAEDADVEGESAQELDATEVDLTSQVVIGGQPASCSTSPTLGLITWTSGNVKVR